MLRFSTRNNCCEFLAFYGVNSQSVIPSITRHVTADLPRGGLNHELQNRYSLNNGIDTKVIIGSLDGILKGLVHIVKFLRVRL